MTVSVIIPCYNVARYIEQTLASVINQTYEDWECICVDDGSKDDTAAIIEAVAAREPRLKLIRQPNCGVGTARNTGYAAASSETLFVAFLDADDTWEPSFLQVLFDELNSNSQCVAAYCKFRFFAAPEDKLLSFEVWDEERITVRGGKVGSLAADEPTTFAELVYTCVIKTPGQVLIRKAAAEMVGAMAAERDICPCSEWDYWIRLSRISPFSYVRQELLNYRQHPDSLSKNLRNMSRASVLVRRRTVGSADNTLEQSRWAINAFRWWSARLVTVKLRFALQALKKGHLAATLKEASYALRPLQDYILTLFMRARPGRTARRLES